MRMNRPKKSPRSRKAAHAIRRLKKSVARSSSTRLAWATSSLAVVAMIFLGAAAALLTAREDVHQAPVTFATTPLPRAVKKEPQRPLAKETPISLKVAQSSVAEPAGTATVTGCLENDEGTFVLTDASGAKAPASRNWKSGFLKKRAAPIELTDDNGTLNLRQHVGRRISATGTLIGRDMRALSVRRIGSCD